MKKNYADPIVIQEILSQSKTIAVVGLSPKPDRASHYVSAYLQSNGYQIIPVNPRIEEVLGETAYPDLLSIPKEIKVDLVDVFRRPEECPAIAEQAVKIDANALWLQLQIDSQEAATIAERGGLQVVMNRCTKVEHAKYFK